MRAKLAVAAAYAVIGLFDQLQGRQINALVMVLASALWFYAALRSHERVKRDRKQDPEH